MYHYRANNDYSLNQSKRKSRIGRELKEEVVCVLAASKPGEFALFPAMKLDELCTEKPVLVYGVLDGPVLSCRGVAGRLPVKHPFFRFRQEFHL